MKSAFKHNDEITDIRRGGYSFVMTTEDGGYSIWKSDSGKYIIRDVYDRIIKENIRSVEDAMQLADELEAKDHMYK